MAILREIVPSSDDLQKTNYDDSIRNLYTTNLY